MPPVPYCKNNDFFDGSTLEQDPVSSTQLHVAYNFGRGVWAALRGAISTGLQLSAVPMGTRAVTRAGSCHESEVTHYIGIQHEREKI
jgi:hypothetical protein